jgi:glucose-1-phosphate thymidylyltransferase
MSSNFKIIIPMAGFGSRMRPHTWTRPKPLLYLAGKTVLDHALEQFNTLPGLAEAEYVFIVSPNQGEMIQEHMQSVHPEKKVHFVVQEHMRGQSDALLNAREFMHGPILVAFSDTLIETDLQFLSDETTDGIAWVKPMPDPRRFGVAETNKDGWITRLIEKPADITNNQVLVGFYYFHDGKQLLKAIQEQIKSKISLKNEYFLADAVNLMLGSGAKFQAHNTEVWLDAGIPEALLETNRYLLDHGRCDCAVDTNLPGVTIIPPVSIPAGTELESSVIGPYVTLGEGCKIKNVVVRNSIIEAGTCVTDMVVEGSLIGRDVHLEGKPDRLNIGDNSWVTK